LIQKVVILVISTVSTDSTFTFFQSTSTLTLKVLLSVMTVKIFKNTLLGYYFGMMQKSLK